MHVRRSRGDVEITGPAQGPAWACPQCRRPFSRSDTCYKCDFCGRAWPIVDGIPHFVSDAPYWGEIPESTLRWILEEMKTRHWKEVLSDDPDLACAFTFILNLNRVNWQYLLPATAGRQLAALCVGEGMGTTAHALAPNYSTVVAAEQALSRVEFMQQRFRQDRIANIRVVRATFPDLPFADESFDLIVFNGVLEWLPSSQPSKPPAQTQLEGLRKAFRLLKPGCHVYVGIENRWCYEYFLGAKDPHVGLPWVTILPRGVASWLTRRSTGRRYVNYLYGTRGYRRLLERAGFSTIQTFFAKENYNNPEWIVPVSGHVSRHFFRAIDVRPRGVLRSVFQAVAARTGLLGRMQYAFVIIAAKQ